MKASDVLLHLAADFVQQKRYVEAVKCLQPVSESSELPVAKVKARLALAQLLLAHFDNEAEARQQLKQAVRGREEVRAQWWRSGLRGAGTLSSGRPHPAGPGAAAHGLHRQAAAAVRGGGLAGPVPQAHGGRGPGEGGIHRGAAGRQAERVGQGAGGAGAVAGLLCLPAGGARDPQRRR